jgi:exopolysaccharide biosynthesis predicted pyruvyltransferase EpsI
MFLFFFLLYVWTSFADHMLTVAEIEFIENTLKRGTAEQCHYLQAGDYYPNCDKIIAQKDPSKTRYALWHAGGNWGDLWRSAQDVRIDSFQTLLKQNYTVIGMPQSLYYTQKYLEQKDSKMLMLKIAIGLGLMADPTPEYGWADDDSQLPAAIAMATEVFKKPASVDLAHRRVILTWREKESYEAASQLYPFVRHVVAPDIAFQLGPFERINSHHSKNVDVLVFLRDDIESMVESKRREDLIQNILSEKSSGGSLSSMVVDWNDRLKIFDTTDDFFTSTAIELLSLGKVVVCDRLHAAILAYLAGIPFVYIDQISGKVSKTLNVAFDGLPDCQNGEKTSLWASAASLEEALGKAAQMIRANNLDQSSGGFFSRLRNFIP